MPTSVANAKRGPEETIDEASSDTKRVKSETNGNNHLENGLLKGNEEIDGSPDTRGLQIENLRSVLAKVLERDYKDITAKEFEDMLLIRIADYFSNYHPSVQLQRQVIALQRKYSRLEEQYNRVIKHFYDMRYILKRMADQKKAKQAVEELPCRPIRSVAVQVQASRCRGGEFCPGNGAVLNKVSENVDPNVVNSQPQNQNNQRKQRTSVVEIPSTSTSSSTSSQAPVPINNPSAAPVVDLTDTDDPAQSSDGKKATAQNSSSTKNKVASPSTNNLVNTATKGSDDSPVPIEKVKLPPPPKCPSSNPLSVRPPQPILRINRAEMNGILLSWTLKGLSNGKGEPKIPIASYQVFACQEINKICKEWSPVGDVKALPLPMACTLSQFREGNRYHFIVRAVDKYDVHGEFSSPASILLKHRDASSTVPTASSTAPSTPPTDGR